MSAPETQEAPERSFVAPTRPNSPTNEETESDEEMKVVTKKRRRNEAPTPRKKQKKALLTINLNSDLGAWWGKNSIVQMDVCFERGRLSTWEERCGISGGSERTIVFPTMISCNDTKENKEIATQMQALITSGCAHHASQWTVFTPKKRSFVRLRVAAKESEKMEKKEVKAPPVPDPFSAFRKDLLALPVKDGPNLALMEQRMLQIQREGMTPQQIKEDQIEWENEKRQAMETALFDLMRFATAIW